MTIVDFLLARIAEDEAVARPLLPATNEIDGDWETAAQYDVKSYLEPFMLRFSPARVLAECEARRAVFALHHRTPLGTLPLDICDVCADSGGAATEWPCDTLRALALPYASHPDFRAEWA